MKKYLLIPFCSVLLSCGGGGSGNSSTHSSVNGDAGKVSETIATLQSTGDLPVLDTTSSLVGKDVNADGIRDDIEAYIASEPVSQPQQTAMLDVAASLQSIQALDLSSPDRVQAVSAEMAQSIVCISNAFDNPAEAHKYLKKLEAYTANTPERAQRYIDYNHQRDGSVTRLPSASGC